MNEFSNSVVKFGPIILVGISTLLAIIVFYRNKKNELENTLFKTRLEAIGIIQMEIVVFFQCLDRMKLFLKQPELVRGENLNDMSLEVDDQMYKCQASLARYSSYFSESAKQKVYLFMENILGELNSSTKGKMELITAYQDHQIMLSETALEAMKKEAGINEIHESLIKRFTKNSR